MSHLWMPMIITFLEAARNLLLFQGRLFINNVPSENIDHSQHFIEHVPKSIDSIDSALRVFWFMIELKKSFCFREILTLK